VGAVIVSQDNIILSTGYNGWPRGVNDFVDNDLRFQKPEKYVWMAHAERNAIDNASHNGIRLKGSIMYGLLPPCADCTRGIIQAGISEYVLINTTAAFYSDVKNLTPESASNWYALIDQSSQMLTSAGVKFRVIEAETTALAIRLGGEVLSLTR